MILFEANFDSTIVDDKIMIARDTTNDEKWPMRRPISPIDVYTIPFNPLNNAEQLTYIMEQLSITPAWSQDRNKVGAAIFGEYFEARNTLDEAVMACAITYAKDMRHKQEQEWLLYPSS